jgi:hypothetical protein
MKTTIKIDSKVRDKLNEIGKRTETYNDIILRLIALLDTNNNGKK